MQFTNAIFNIITYPYLFVLLGIRAYDFMALKNTRNKYTLKYKHNKHYFFQNNHYKRSFCKL